MHLEVITPDKKVLSEEIEELSINTPSGHIGILPHHVHLVTKVVAGEMTVKIKGKEKYYAITGGFLEVNEDTVTILADYAVESEEIEVEKALQAKKRAEEILKKTKEHVTEKDFAIAQAELRRAVMELHVANRRRKVRSSIPQK